jgi:hypothetical protein
VPPSRDRLVADTAPAASSPHSREAQAIWPALPAACRGGTFFLAAAELFKARRAQALALAGKRREARALVKPATAALRDWPFDIPAATTATLKKKLAAL